MQYLFEYSDTLNSPYEAFLYDTLTMAFPIRPHWHYFMEIIYMKEGTGLIECEGKSYIVEAGDLILFHPEAVHAIYTATNLPLKYEVLKFDVNKLYTENSYVPKLRSILRNASKDKNATVFFREEDIRSLSVGTIFEDCRRELERKDYGYDIIVHNRICYLLVNLIRMWREEGFDTDKAAEYAKETDSIQAITTYIDAHAGEQIKVEELADMCNMSYSYFAKNFKQYYGRSCKEYIEFIRISKAEDLLLFTDFDLSYISQETGFSDSSHLIKIFRKWKGVTPKQYKLRYARADKE
ncbi:MAG: AraC family transcriptional regulator [Suilimivivens sp.]